MYKSDIESKVFNLNFYRAKYDFLLKNIEEQKLFLEKNKVDIVKFIIDSRQSNLFDKLGVFKKIIFLNSILNYEKHTTEIEYFPDNNHLELINANKDDSELIGQLVKEVFENAIIGYSKISFLKDKISKQQEVLAIQTYLIDLLNQPNSGIQLYKDSSINEVVGFSSFSINNNIIYRAYAGIIPKYWNLHYYENLIYSMIRFNYIHKIDAITFGARADNLALINKFSRVGCKVSSIDYTFVAEV